jgi:NADH-quinone oxidoreductase subunit L
MPSAVAAHAAPSGELAAMALVSLLIAVAGVLVATWFYRWRPELPDRMAAQYPTAYRILLNKYYVDEIYDALFVEPIKRGAVWLWRRFDEPVVDGSVNGVGAIVRTASILLRYLQTGYVMNYVLSFILGVVVILGYVAFRW